ncbi:MULTISPECIES: toxin-antitoxin system, toxin component family protein [unclassified Streptomyces]|uniref:toxin-antitoxin system, toxin component family protein n=1 Tax=unclassified Streptomyces TaxID=2593676 RepID=UPI001661AF56|nr:MULTISPECIES: toxin-antitoxin system, toxin component family protein [unclassified Streptomyces]MBD0837477.1 toxin-antitoxin system, toxin component family protein [Streptomyces sp. TRM68416]
MDIAGARRRASRVAAALRRSRGGPAMRGIAMRGLAADLATALRARPRPPADVRELCAALCEEMTARRGGRRVELRFERFPDEFEVTGLWLEFQDFDLVIVEERAEAVQQLVILGHELWHLHAGHRHHRQAGSAAAGALADGPGLRDALAIAARNGSREREEAEADDFGHRLAALFRPLLSAVAQGPLDPLQRALGYRGRGGPAR